MMVDEEHRTSYTITLEDILKRFGISAPEKGSVAINADIYSKLVHITVCTKDRYKRD